MAHYDRTTSTLNLPTARQSITIIKAVNILQQSQLSRICAATANF